MTNGSKFLIGSLVVFVLFNVGYLDYKAISVPKPSSMPQVTFSPSIPTQTFPMTKIVDEKGTETLVPDYSAISDTIYDATSSLTFRIEKLEKSISSPTTSSKTATSQVSPVLSSTVKEYYIPLGSSKLSASNWTDLPGVEAYVAPVNFGGIKDMYFEVSLNVPSGVGTAYARLRNTTDDVSLFESEVSREGGSPGLVSSGKIPVPHTTKLYRVQVKSSLGAEIEIVSARIKLFVQ